METVSEITNRAQLRLCDASVDFILTDPHFEEMTEKSNEISLAERLVSHGIEHALEVYASVNRIISLAPRHISRYRRATARVAALLHDIGRGLGDKDHAKTGALLAVEYLNGVRINGEPLPVEFISRVAFLVANHRAESWLPGVREFDAVDIILLLLSDKLSGSEARLVIEKLLALKKLAEIPLADEFRQRYHLDKTWSLARLPRNRSDLLTVTEFALSQEAEAVLLAHEVFLAPDLEVDRHDQVNGSISQRGISIECGRLFVYSIVVDERIAPFELVTGLDWWSDALLLSVKCANYLGLTFVLEFNGDRHSYDDSSSRWLPLSSIQ